MTGGMLPAIDNGSVAESKPVERKHQRLLRYVPALSFIGGFAWDALTLGRSIKAVDLWILLGYLVGAATVLAVVGRLEESKLRSRLLWLFQFLVGGVFSALVIFYFLSSSNAPAFIVVTMLTALLVGNEFLDSRYGRMTIAWSVFAVATVMFCNFALPHLLHSISRFSFHVSTAIAIALVLALRAVSRSRSFSIKPALILTVLLLLLHALNLIPPVPLVQKQMVIALSVARSQGWYKVTTERRGVQRLNIFDEQKVHRRAGEPIYCFTSVFVPRGIRTTLRHRWMYLQKGEWTTTDVISFPISGGRDEGYRGYTRKSSVPAGSWRVVTESETGARLGIAKFEVVRGEARGVRTRRM
jgi:hypothetical protein